MSNPRDVTGDLRRLRERSVPPRESGTTHPPALDEQPIGERTVSRDLAVWISYGLVIIILVGEVVMIMVAYRSG